MSFAEALVGPRNFPALPLLLKGSSDKFEVLVLKGQEAVGTSTSEFAFGKEEDPRFSDCGVSSSRGLLVVHTHVCINIYRDEGRRLLKNDLTLYAFELSCGFRYQLGLPNSYLKLIG